MKRMVHQLVGLLLTLLGLGLRRIMCCRNRCGGCRMRRLEETTLFTATASAVHDADSNQYALEKNVDLDKKSRSARHNLLIFVSVILLTLSFIGCSSKRNRSPEYSFDIRDTLPRELRSGFVGIRKFLAGSSKLYFELFVRSGKNEKSPINSVIIRSEMNGIFEQVMGRNMSLIGLGSGGTIYASRWHKNFPSNGGEILVVGSDRMIRQSLRFDQRFTSVGSVARSVVGLTEKGRLQVCPLDKREVTYPIADQTFVGKFGASQLVLPISPQKIMLVDRVYAHAVFVNLNSGIVKEFDLNDPEIVQNRQVLDKIQIVNTPEHTDDLDSVKTANKCKPNRRISFAIQELIRAKKEGEFYASLGPQVLARGALIVKFDEDGQVLERYRFMLPSFAELKSPSNPHGHMPPSKIAVVEDLFVIVSSMGRGAVYRISRSLHERSRTFLEEGETS